MEQARATIERQLGQMVRLVDDLLDVGRISCNKLELQAERVDLASIVRHAVEACRPFCDEGHHEIIVTLTPDPIYLQADSVRLTQVFGNLLNNSCKYSEPETRIWVTAERQGNDVAVTVKDAGIGIPPDMLPRCSTVHAGRSVVGAFGGRARHRPVAREATRRDARRHGDGSQRRARPRQ
jgi:signal transduction histidine kinase